MPSGKSQARRLYKTGLVRLVARQTRLSQRDVADAFGGALRQLTSALARGERVVLPGFGTFYARLRLSSQARQFGTGEQIQVPAMRVVGFRVGEVLKRAVRKPR